jgi:hypothetical protein
VTVRVVLAWGYGDVKCVSVLVYVVRIGKFARNGRGT